MKIHLWLPCVFAIASSSVASRAMAQAPSPRSIGVSRYRVDDGEVVVMGLRNWTLRQLADSLRRRRPGLELHDAACMAVLKRELRFPDALVEEISLQAAPDAPPARFTVVKIVEPADSARVAWDRARRDSARVLVPDYAPAILAATDSLGRLWIGNLFWPLQFYGDSARMAWAASRPPASRAADAARFWAFLRDRANEGSRRRAMAVLRGDANYANRLMALAVLSNFAGHDSTWYAVIEALRDRSEAVRDAAQIVLRILPPRPVDWRPAATTLGALLAGTNVSATEGVMTALARTRVSPQLRDELLKGDGEWVLVHLDSPVPGAADAAHELLVALAGGRDLGRDRAAWRRWVAGP